MRADALARATQRFDVAKKPRRRTQSVANEHFERSVAPRILKCEFVRWGACAHRRCGDLERAGAAALPKIAQ